MRKYAFILLMSCFLSLTLSAQDKHDLLGKWEVSLEENNNDTSWYFTNSWMFIEFMKSDKALFMSPDSNSDSLTMNYKVDGDRLIIITEEKTDTIAFRVWDNYLKLEINPKISLTYSRFEKESYQFNMQDILSSLTNEVWLFTEHDQKENIFFDFSDRQSDPGYYMPPFKDLGIRHNNRIQKDPYFWSLNEFARVPYLLIKSKAYNWYTNNYFIRSFSRNHITLTYWSSGSEYTLEGTKLEGWDEKRVRKILTSHKWRFSRQKLSEPQKDYGENRDLGMISGDYKRFNIPDYQRDSTLLISESDLENKSLVLNFENDNSYQILRNESVLDEGQWSFVFNNRGIEMKSNRANGEGMYGGYVFIKKITSRRLTFWSQWQSDEDMIFSTKPSHLETYRAIKK